MDGMSETVRKTFQRTARGRGVDEAWKDIEERMAKAEGSECGMCEVHKKEWGDCRKQLELAEKGCRRRDKDLRKAYGVVEYLQVLIPQLHEAQTPEAEYALDWVEGALIHNQVPLESEASKKRVKELKEMKDDE